MMRLIKTRSQLENLERDRQFFLNVPKNVNHHSLETIKAKTLEILSQIYPVDIPILSEKESYN